MKWLLLSVSLTLVLFVLSAHGDKLRIEPEEEQCDGTVDKSAVTKEAAEAAARTLRNPPTRQSSEIYSSKVKSKLTYFQTKSSIELLYIHKSIETGAVFQWHGRGRRRVCRYKSERLLRQVSHLAVLSSRLYVRLSH